MIFDSIQNKENYREYEMLYQILCYLDSLKQGELPLPDTVICENRVFCNPVSLTSKPEEACIYEAHKKYIDLHYIVAGREGIATADVKSLTESVSYNAERDIAFYKGSASGRYLLNPGDFMVCYPSDAHMVAIMENKPENIEKVVVKIKVQ
ncbi:YhcH/YjgK/YiaL family protein [Blautia producta]|uniref:YhcH/YjgK/YiaL family protein n=2 Tax=Blautia producta TaxID=33035 RepID=A0A7G5MZ76_9FIRM|nr:YhcH/YjgK/YiaL family protein [Blautia producta]QIB57303.1 DUF386 domain-containing protein [Blautia producta ATCC 27340 = DSM 2950]QMW79919.1 YhcH/YjgK/YiaL family protein [Blautia producta]